MSNTDIPGDPGGLSALASQVRNAASDVESVASDVSNQQLGGSWHGAAGSAFHHSIGQLPSELSKAASAFNDGAAVLSTFASQLAGFQHQARSYAAQIATAQAEQRAAMNRQAQAETSLARAKLKHSLATDPVSLHTLKSAVDVGVGVLHQALAHVEDTNATVSRLESFAASNYSDYQHAVAAAANHLDGARHPGNHSFGAWAGSHVRALIGDVEHGLGAAGREGKRLARDVEHGVADVARATVHGAEDVARGAAYELDHHWAGIREILKDSAGALAIVAIGALMLTGAGEAILALTIAGAVVDGAVTAGDAFEASRPWSPDQKVGADNLAGDAVDTGIALVGVAGAAGAGNFALKGMADAAAPHIEEVAETTRNIDAVPATTVIGMVLRTEYAADKFGVSQLIGPPVDDAINRAYTDGTLGKVARAGIEGLSPALAVPTAISVPVQSGLAR